MLNSYYKNTFICSYVMIALHTWVWTIPFVFKADYFFRFQICLKNIYYFRFAVVLDWSSYHNVIILFFCDFMNMLFVLDRFIISSVMWMLYTVLSYLNLIFRWVLNLFGIFFILAGHEHYSIDVFIGGYLLPFDFLLW